MTSSVPKAVIAAPKKRAPVRAIAEPGVAKPAIAEPKEMIVEEMMKNAAEETQVKAKAMLADAGDRAKGAMEKGAKMVEELGAFGKGNVEAVVESTKIAARGIETMGQDAAAYTRKSFEGATAAIRTLAAVKSPTEFMKLQSDYARSMFDAVIAETSRSTEAMLKLAGEVAQPISNRMAIAADKMKIAA